MQLAGSWGRIVSPGAVAAQHQGDLRLLVRAGGVRPQTRPEAGGDPGIGSLDGPEQQALGEHAGQRVTCTGRRLPSSEL